MSKRAGSHVSKSFEEKFKAMKETNTVLARELGVPLNTASTWLKNRANTEAAITSSQLGSSRKRKRDSTFAEVDEAL